MPPFWPTRKRHGPKERSEKARDPLLRDGQAERRGAQRYKLHLNLEIWPRDGKRGVYSLHEVTDNISALGFSFISEVRWRVGAKFNFWITMPPVFSDTLSGLMSGLAQVVRCEALEDGERHRVSMQVKRNAAGEHP